MTTLSVPLPPELGEWVNQMVRRGYAENKAALVRKALRGLAEEEAIAAVLRSEQEFRAGKALTGDLHKLLKKIKK